MINIIIPVVLASLYVLWDNKEKKQEVKPVYSDKILKEYDARTRLSREKRVLLREKREELGENIKSIFQDKGRLTPDFKGQGSFSMGTIINPKNEGDEYDIDYGVYINIDTIKDKDGNYIKAETAQNWVEQAVEKYEKENETDITGISHKNKCIRVKYESEITIKDPDTEEEKKSVEKFHVDLPVYFIELSSPPFLVQF